MVDVNRIQYRYEVEVTNIAVMAHNPKEACERARNRIISSPCGITFVATDESGLTHSHMCDMIEKG